MTESSENQGEEYIRMSRVGEVIRSNTGVMATVWAIFVAAALAYAYMAEPEYQVSSKFLTTGSRGQNQQMALLSQLANLQSATSPALADPANYFPDLLEDDAFLSTILHGKFALGKDSTDLERYWATVPDTAAAVGDWRYAHEKRLLERLKGRHIDIRREENGLLVLETRFDSPLVALAVNRMVLGQLEDYLEHKMKGNLGNSRHFIEAQMEEAADRLETSERRLTDFNMRNLHVTSPAILGDQRKLVREVNINQELYLELKKQFFMARIEEVKSSPTLEVISEPTLPITRQRPKRTLLVIAGAFMGLLFAFMAALLREWLGK